MIVTLILDVYDYKLYLVMKILLIFLIFVVFLGAFFIVDSDAYIGPPTPREHPSFKEISLQIQIHNSDGVLVAYLEPTNFFLRNVNMIHEFLDTQENKTIIVIDGKNYEQIEFEFKHRIGKEGQRASYVIGWEGIGVLSGEHNVFISDPDDTMTVSWKIIRTIQ